MHDLGRKSRKCIWIEEQKSPFEKIKRELQETPLLYLLDIKDKFHLYSDFSNSKW